MNILLILYQLLQAIVSSVSSNVESLLVNFKILFTLGSIDFSCTLNGSLPKHHSIALCIDHLENSGLLGNTDIPNINAFHYAVSRNHSC